MLKKFKTIQGNKVEAAKPLRPQPVPSNDSVHVSRIGEAIVLEGSLGGSGDLVVEGRIKGEVSLPDGRLVIARNACVEAGIHVRNVKISGRMKGTIVAPENVEITAHAEFEGEIRTGSLSVEDGAFLKAVVEVEKEKARSTVTKSAEKLIQKSQL